MGTSPDEVPPPDPTRNLRAGGPGGRLRGVARLRMGPAGTAGAADRAAHQAHREAARIPAERPRRPADRGPASTRAARAREARAAAARGGASALLRAASRA